MSSPYRPIWIDNSSRDPGAIKVFYAGLFGWDMVTNDDPMYGGYIGVEDVAAKHAQVLAAGAREIVEPMPFPGGTFSIVADPPGGVFGLLKLG